MNEPPRKKKRVEKGKIPSFEVLGKIREGRV